MFPCKFNNPNCRGFFGCKCGKFGKAKKEAEAGLGQVGKQVYEAGKMLPEEEQLYLQTLRGTPELLSIARYLSGMGEAPTGYRGPEAQYLQEAGPIGRGFYEQTQRRLERPFAEYDPMERAYDPFERAYDPMAYYYDPEEIYETQLPRQLEVAQDIINRQAQQRGLLRSGIPIEEMGRAGVELAIREAERRLELAREKSQVGLGLEREKYGMRGELAREKYGMTGELEREREQMRQLGLAGAGEFTQYARGQTAENLARMSELYGAQQQFGQTAMGRQAGQMQAAAPYYAKPYEQALSRSYYNPWSVGWSAKEGLKAGYKGYGV